MSPYTPCYRNHFLTANIKMTGIFNLKHGQVVHQSLFSLAVPVSGMGGAEKCVSGDLLPFINKDQLEQSNAQISGLVTKPLVNADV